MLQWSVFALFLYFPQDKTEYIPASITMAICLVIAIFTMKFIVKQSKREEQKTKALEEKLLQGKGYKEE